MTEQLSDVTRNDLLSPDLAQLLQLFSALPEVRFPDLDPSTLQDSVARIKERHLELLHIEAQLQAVRGALEDEQEALLKKGHRLRAYLEVYAENDEALATRLRGLSLPKLRRAAPRPDVPAPVVEGEAPAPRKRGRPRKVPATETLFGATAAPAPAP